MKKEPSLLQVLALSVREIFDFSNVFLFPIMAFLAYRYEVLITYAVFYGLLLILLLINYCCMIYQTDDENIRDKDFNFHFFIYLPNFGLFLDNKINEFGVVISRWIIMIYHIMAIVFNIVVFFSSRSYMKSLSFGTIVLYQQNEYSSIFHIVTLITSVSALIISIIEMTCFYQTESTCYFWAFKRSIRSARGETRNANIIENQYELVRLR